MIITDRLDSSENVATTMFNNHFKSSAAFRKADNVKLGKKNYIWELSIIHTEGRMNVAQAILMSHIDNPYTTVDELIGDIQMILQTTNNHLTRLMPNHHRGTSIEKILNDIEKVKANIEADTISAVS